MAQGGPYGLTGHLRLTFTPFTAMQPFPLSPLVMLSVASAQDVGTDSSSSPEFHLALSFWSQLKYLPKEASSALQLN